MLPGPWATQEMSGRASHGPPGWVVLHSPGLAHASDGWTGRPGAGLWWVKEGLLAGPAALWALARHPLSPRRGQAVPDAGHLQTGRNGIEPPAQERKWRRGQAQDRIREGGPRAGAAGRPGWASHLAGALFQEAGSRAGLLCRSACAHMCVHVCTRACMPCSGPEPHTWEL